MLKRYFLGNATYETLSARLKDKQTASTVLEYSGSAVGEEVGELFITLLLFTHMYLCRCLYVIYILYIY